MMIQESIAEACAALNHRFMDLDEEVWAQSLSHLLYVSYCTVSSPQSLSQSSTVRFRARANLSHPGSIHSVTETVSAGLTPGQVPHLYAEGKALYMVMFTHGPGLMWRTRLRHFSWLGSHCRRGLELTSKLSCVHAAQ